MRTLGRRGYIKNIFDEYESRAHELIKSLIENNKSHCAFVVDFIKADYINVAKLLLYLILKGKVRTDLDGVFIDKQLSHYLKFQDKNEATKEITDISVNDKRNTLHNKDTVINTKEETKEETKKETKEGKRENICTRKKIIVLQEDWRKLEITSFEVGNMKDIMSFDGTVKYADNLIYYLNPCSVLAVHFLKVKKGDKVLDMCAAPGGKSLAIAKALFGSKKSPINRIRSVKQMTVSDSPYDIYAEVECDTILKHYCTLSKKGFLVSNEFSKHRCERLETVLKRHIPKELFDSNNIVITKYNALFLNQFSRFHRFDKILLDAPCSSDKYLIRNDSELSKWSPDVIKKHASVQFQILCNCFELLKPGGILIYSTCALSCKENDEVIAKFQKKYGSAIMVIDFIEEEFKNRMEKLRQKNQKKNEKKNSQKNNENTEKYIKKMIGSSTYLSFFERTKHGYISMPDKSPFGLIYICKIKKNS